MFRDIFGLFPCFLERQLLLIFSFIHFYCLYCLEKTKSWPKIESITKICEKEKYHIKYF